MEEKKSGIFFTTLGALPGENYQESESQISTLPHDMPRNILFLVTSIFRLSLK